MSDHLPTIVNQLITQAVYRSRDLQNQQRKSRYWQQELQQCLDEMLDAMQNHDSEAYDRVLSELGANVVLARVALRNDGHIPEL